MTTPDPGLERELDALQARYAAEAGDEPPQLLDQAILNRARHAVEPRSIRPWNFGWMHATASVALVVIGLTLVLELRQTRDMAVPESAREALRGPQATLETEKAESFSAGEVMDRASPGQTAEPARTDIAAKEDSDAARFEPERDAVLPQASPQSPRTETGPQHLGETVNTEPADSVGASSASLELRRARQLSPKREAEPAARPENQAAADIAPLPEAAGTRPTLAPDPSEEAPLANMSDSPAGDRIEIQAAEVDRASTDRLQRVNEDRREERERHAESRAAAFAAQRDAASFRADPEPWLQHLRDLLEAGQSTEAATEWQAFRAAYPDFPVPAELESRLSALPESP